MKVPDEIREKMRLRMVKRRNLSERNNLMQFAIYRAEFGYRCSLYGESSPEASVKYILDAIEYLETIKIQEQNKSKSNGKLKPIDQEAPVFDVTLFSLIGDIASLETLELSICIEKQKLIQQLSKIRFKLNILKEKLKNFKRSKK